MLVCEAEGSDNRNMDYMKSTEGGNYKGKYM